MPRKKSFRTWLRSQLMDDSPIGDLADDAIHDRGWSGDTVESLRLRVIEQGSPPWAMQAIDEAEERYRQYLQEVNKNGKTSKAKKRAISSTRTRNVGTDRARTQFT